MLIRLVVKAETVKKLTGDYDAIYLLAAMADVNDVYKNPVEAGEVNILGVANVLEAARRNEIDRVILASTVLGIWFIFGARGGRKHAIAH